ncbi:hypothetical protein [Vibrio phage Artemius]|nr:hypothetical protein [Vibrio phage Artemius]
MCIKTYQNENQVLYVCFKTNTLRLWPENYLVAKHNGGHWQLDPDLACPLQTVLLVTAALMEHDVKWSNVNDCKLLSRVTGDNVKHWLKEYMSYTDSLESLALGVRPL